MTIEVERKVFEQIIGYSSGLNYETGGFIGICNHRIHTYFFDDGTRQKGTYCPNRDIFYELIEKWGQKGMTAFGIFHTHLNGNPSLSGEDIGYINSIFESNTDLEEMFFPVIIPEKEICVYLANRKNEEVLINLVALKII